MPARRIQLDGAHPPDRGRVPGLEEMLARARRVTEATGCVPLKKDFAAKLSPKLRPAFEELVEQVHGSRRTPMPTLTFYKRYAS